MTALLVLARVVANPIANVFQKQLTRDGAHPLFIIAATHALLTLGSLSAFAAGVVPPPSALSAAFWMNMSVCAVLAVAGNVLLVYALRSTDLSLLGPINTYKAILGLVLGVFLLGEVPTMFGLAGVVLIIAGNYVVVDRAPGESRGNAFRRFLNDSGVQLRFAALVCTATEAVFLKRALLHSSPATTFVWWAVLGLPVASAAIALSRPTRIGPEIARVGRLRRSYLWLAVATGAMQLTTLLVFDALQVGYALALFQLSTLITVLLGSRYFGEPHVERRLIGAAVMVAGAVLIVILGGTD